MKDGIRAMCLADIMPGERAFVERISADSAMKKRLIDIGLISGTAVECVGESPLGDPRAYLVRDAVIAIRKVDGRGIFVSGGDGR